MIRFFYLMPGPEAKRSSGDKKVLVICRRTGDLRKRQANWPGIPPLYRNTGGDRILRLPCVRSCGLSADDRYLDGDHLPKKSGIVLQNFLIEKMQKEYTKPLSMLRWGEYSEELFQMEGELDMTAICLQENGDQVGLTQRGSSRLVELPYDLLYSHPHNISI